MTGRSTQVGRRAACALADMKCCTERGNTKVTIERNLFREDDDPAKDDMAAYLWLHDNAIAKHFKDGRLLVSMCGWGTPTTRSRLNDVLNIFGINAQFHQKNGDQYLSGPQGSLKVDIYSFIDPRNYVRDVVAAKLRGGAV